MLPALFSFLLVLSVHEVWGITCECEMERCLDEESLKRRCKGGLVWEPYCSCCKICARIEGEECGGIWSPLTLLCDEGLVCVLLSSRYSYGKCRPAPHTTPGMKKIAPVVQTTTQVRTLSTGIKYRNL